MWLLRSTHKHIAQDTLNEYLDERLQDRALETVEQQLGECDACRLELEELRATVAMMQTLPMEAPRWSFVMSAPPPEPARAHPMLALRAPNWIYTGAASVSDPAGQDAQVATLATSALSVAESESVAEDVTAASKSADIEAGSPEATPQDGAKGSPGPGGIRTPREFEPAEPELFDDVVISGTSVWWRVLEVAAGVLAVLFLAALAIRWKSSRRDSV